MMRFWRWLHRLTHPRPVRIESPLGGLHQYRRTLLLEMRRPTSGAFAKISTPESQRSSHWKPRDLSDRRERRESGFEDLTACERLVVDLARDLGIADAEAAERLRRAIAPVEPLKKSGPL